jgi:hypothetical protein
MSANAKFGLKTRVKNQPFSKISNKDFSVYFVYNLIFSGGKISSSTGEPLD